MPPACACGSQASQGARARREDRQRPDRERLLDTEGREHAEDGDHYGHRRGESHTSILGRATSSVNPDDRLDGPIGRTISMLFTQLGLQLLEATGCPPTRDGSVALLGGEREPSLATVGCRQDSGCERSEMIVGRQRSPRRGPPRAQPPPLLDGAAACAAR